MQLFGKRLGSITAQDILALVSRATSESLELEYKRDLPGGSDGDRHEYLADVSAMANTQGGLIVYGISEKKDDDGKNTGTPEEIVGLPNLNLDVLGQGLRNLALAGLNPQLPSIEFQLLDVDGKNILILGVPRSLYGPHAVWFKQSGKFYRRDAFGKRQVAPMELSQMFLEQHEWAEQAEAFRQSRIRKAFSGETGIAIPDRAPTFVHILPLGRLHTTISIFEGDWQRTASSAFVGRGSMDWTPNFDGFLVQESGRGTDPPTFYTQAFRFGGFEFYTSRLWRDEPRGIFLPGAQAFLDDSTRKALPILRDQWEIEPPYAVLLSICRTKNVVGYYQSAMGFTEKAGPPIRQPDLLFPATILSIEDLDKPDRYVQLINMVWQAAGTATSACR